MKSFFAIVAAAAMAAVANSAPCDLLKLTPLLNDPNVKQCTADTGFQPPIPPTADMMPKVCKSTACGAALKTLKGLGLGDCTVGSVALETNLIGPIEKACSGPAPTTAPTSGPTSGPTQSPTKGPTPAPTKVAC